MPEDLPPTPISPYGRSKLMTEWMLADAASAHGFSLRRAALLQRRRRRPARPHRPIDARRHPPHQGRGARRRSASATHLEVFGTDYPTPRRLVPARLHPGLRPRRGPSRRPRPSAGRRREPDAELRLRPRLFGAGGDRGGEARLGRRLPGAPLAAPPGRSGRDRRRGRPHPDDLGWTPQHDDLDGIVAQALAWEEALARRNRT